MSNSLHLSDPRRSLTVPMLFASLEEGLRERLIAGSPARAYGDGQLIQQRGTRPDGFWLIDQGSVWIGQHSVDGEFRAAAVLGPGDSYGELAVFAGTPRVVDAVARKQARVRFIAAAAFLSALEDYPQSNRALLGALSAQLQNTLDQLAGLRRGSNSARLAGLLVNLAGPDGVARITQQELAELLGVTRPTANAALRALEDAKLIRRGYGVVEIGNSPALMAFGSR
ncbi:MAG: Crp/Fnr family transcriptional regulator [Pseudomonadota bacterium]